MTLTLRSQPLILRLGASLRPQSTGEHMLVKLKAGGPDLWWPVVEGAWG